MFQEIFSTGMPSSGGAFSVTLSSSGCRGTVMNEESSVRVTGLPLRLWTRGAEAPVREVHPQKKRRYSRGQAPDRPWSPGQTNSKAPESEECRCGVLWYIASERPLAGWALAPRLLGALRRTLPPPPSAQPIQGTSPAAAPPLEPSFRRVMVYLFVASRGGQNRVRIVESLKGEPANPNQLSERLGLDYKTVQHHLKLLEQNGVIVPNAKGSYGAIYFLTPYFERYYDAVEKMWIGIGQNEK